MNALAKQLTSASNSVENLGRRTRAMSQKLKDVELVSDAQSGERLFGLSGDEIIDNGFEEPPPLVDEPTSKIIVPASRSARAKH